MPSFATATLMGHLGRDPETRPTSGDGSVTTLAVAVTRNSTVRGEKTEETTWWKVAIWGTRGVTAAKHLRKGSLVLVTGWPVVREYTDKDQVVRHSAELRNADWAFAEGRRDGETTAETSTAQNARTPESTVVPTAAPITDAPPF